MESTPSDNHLRREGDGAIHGRQHLMRRQILRLTVAVPLSWVFAACTGRATEVARPASTPPLAPSPEPFLRPGQVAPVVPAPTVVTGGPLLAPSPSPPTAPSPSPAAPSPSPAARPSPAGSFYTRVIMSDPRFRSTAVISDLALLEPITRRKVQAILAAAKQQGLELMVFETYRSQQRQEMLFEEGVTMLKRVGVHHYGLACDLVRNVDGNPSWAGDFSLLGRLAHQHGLIWGGDWGKPNEPNDFVDAYHVQRCSEAKQPELFAGTWYPDDDYDPYAG